MNKDDVPAHGPSPWMDSKISAICTEHISRQAPASRFLGIPIKPVAVRAGSFERPQDTATPDGMLPFQSKLAVETTDFREFL